MNELLILFPAGFRELIMSLQVAAKTRARDTNNQLWKAMATGLYQDLKVTKHTQRPDGYRLSES